MTVIEIASRDLALLCFSNCNPIPTYSTQLRDSEAKKFAIVPSDYQVFQQRSYGMAFSPNRPKAPNQPEAADVSLISELYEAIEASPPGIEARKLLVQQLIACGWLDAARDVVSELLAIVPDDKDAQALLTAITQAQAEVVPAPAKPPPKYIVPIPEIKDVNDARSQISKGYKSLFSKARMLHWEMDVLHKILQQKPQGDRSASKFFSAFGKNNSAVEALVGGQIGSVQDVQFKPGSARKVARQMERNPTGAVDIAFQDLQDTAQWLRSAANRPDPALTTPAAEVDDDAVREALQKRTQALISALSQGLQQAVSTAQMHVEHEILHRTYICTETMYGDPVSDIPRAKFWVTEDGYPWDMEELAQAITSNGGVMRNPLSRQLFTPNDVKAIVQHPLGKSLAALQVTQKELSKGVRPKTIDEMANMSKIMLNDDSSDQMASRHIIDEFLAYVATLPEEEQNALDKLRVPARDSHTGQPFDSSIGEAVRDAQGNRVCIHKIGDFLGQAARHLRQNG